MTQLIVNDVVQVSVEGLIGGRPCVNVFHVDCSRPITGDAHTKAEGVIEAYQNHLIQWFSDAYTITGASFIDLDSINGDSGQVVPDPGEGIVGLRPSGETPQVATLVRKNVSASPRGISFRMFLPPCGQGDVDASGNLTDVYFDALNNSLDAFLTQVDEADGPGTSESHLCCVSYPRFSDGIDKGKVSGPGTAYDLDTYALQRKVATQRRRLRA